jgi:hypothetical protein
MADENLNTTVAQPPETVTPPATTEAKFTQADLDRIISERLRHAESKRKEAEDAAAKKATEETLAKNQEWEKLAKAAQEELAQQKAEIAKRDLADKKLKIAKDAGLPDALASRLIGTTDEELIADAKALLETIPKKSSPAGGITNPPGGAPTKSDAERYAEIFGSNSSMFDPDASRKAGGGVFFKG